jgi:hypothetical protein
MKLMEAPSTNIFLTYATMSIPIGMYPMFLKNLLHLKELKNIINLLIERKKGNPKTSSRITIDVDDAHFSN